MMREPFLEGGARALHTWQLPLLGVGRAAVVTDGGGQGSRWEVRAVDPRRWEKKGL